MSKNAKFQIEKPIYIYFLFGITLLTIIRFISIYTTNTDLFFDEAQYWAWSRHLDFGYFSKPPFLAWSIRGATEICGINEFCIRAPSPLFHAISAILIFFAARSLYDSTTGFWASMVYATLPGVSFSSGHISTDVPLLAFWALALWSLAEFRKTQSWRWAIILGVALGFGLLSKYAMLFFILCFAIHFLLSPDDRKHLTSGKLVVSLLIGLLFITPNLIWNLQNELVTFSHTQDNIKWSGFQLQPHKALEFFSAQFGVFGPILFTILLVLFGRYLAGSRNKNAIAIENDNDRLLLAFSIPIILLITAQALQSRAHANWAATAYPAATILVTAIIVRHKQWSLLTISFILHLAVIAALTLGTMSAGSVALPWNLAPYSRVLGWKELVNRAEQKFSTGKYAAILTNGRNVSAETVYYLHNKNIPIYTWKPGPHPRNYYQMVQPYRGERLEKPMLVISRYKNPKDIQKRFKQFQRLKPETVAAGKNRNRTLYFFSVSGYIANQEKQ